MLRRVLDSMLAIAARAWPPLQRAELVREWNAELYALESEVGVRSWVRGWRRLWFAFSLVLARRTGFGGFAGRGSEAEHLTWHAVALFFGPVVAALPGLIAIGPMTAAASGSSLMAGPVLVATGSVVRIMAGAAVGVGLAVHLLRRVGDRVVGVWGRLLALMPLLAGTVVVGTASPSRGLNLERGDGGFAYALIGAAVLSILLVPMAAIAAVVARRVRSDLARIVLLMPTAALLAMASTAAVVWLSGDRPAWAQAQPWWWLGLLDGVEPGHYPPDDPHAAHPIEDALVRLPGVLLAAAAVALVYMVLTARTRPHPAWKQVRPVAAHTVATPEPGRWWPGTLMAGAAYCAVAWAITLTYLTPHIGVSTMSDLEVLPPGLLESWPGWSKEEGRLWMQDMQLYAIICTVLFFLCAAAYRGLPLFPGLAAGAVLLAIDIAIVRLGLFRLWVTPWLIGATMLLGLLAWRHALRIARSNPTGGQRGRPLVVTVSVLAAYLIPTPHSGWTSQGMAPATPPALVMVIVGLPTLLAALAAIGIVTGIRVPLPGPVWLLPLAAAAVTAVVAGLRLYAPWPEELVNGTTRSPMAIAGLSTALPLAAVTCLLILGLLRNPILLAGAAIGLLLAGPALALASMLSSMMLAPLILTPLRYGQTYDGIAYLPGALATGLAMAILARQHYV